MRHNPESGFEGKRNTRMRDGAEEGEHERWLCSSMRMRKSSSEVTDMREQRSRWGSWYLRTKVKLIERVEER
ncbi:hypothetical protein L6164_007791 [Bauhinia variegata]|uniref:Uncharacterized protein n=1 Tax=Bauhinia variegata TaxID=167791 RepID=A0ACB9PEZ9_BAUVA|nr:hypothetical protein L6164_007791 [Bauhinia variegata]